MSAEQIVLAAKNVVAAFDRSDIDGHGALAHLMTVINEHEHELVDGKSIAITIHLPQTLDKVARLLKVVGSLWPDVPIDTKANWRVEIPADGGRRVNADDVVRAVAALDPIYDHGCGDTGCFFCGVDYVGSSAEALVHDPACPWVAACTLVDADGAVEIPADG